MSYESCAFLHPAHKATMLKEQDIKAAGNGFGYMRQTLLVCVCVCLCVCWGGDDTHSE